MQTITRQSERTLVDQPHRPFVPPTPNEQNWESVRSYLTQTRKLPSAIIDQLHESGLVYADENQNAVFLRRSLPVESSTEPEITGAALRGTVGVNNTFKGLAAGSRRSRDCFYFESKHEGTVEQLVVCKSAIDVLSYATLHPAKQKTRYVSTDGAASLSIEQRLPAPQVILALNPHSVGLHSNDRLQQQFSHATQRLSTATDWNEDLQYHLAQVQQQFAALNRTQGRSNECGFSL